MARLLARAVRLVKIGAAVGMAVGVARMVMRRRRTSDDSESAWPTLAETAARDGRPVDEASEDSADRGTDGTDTGPDEARDAADDDSGDESDQSGADDASAADEEADDKDG